MANTCYGIVLKKPVPAPIYKIYGLDYSPYIGANQSPGNSISEDQIRKTLMQIKPYTTWIRTYGCTDSLANVGKIAHSYGLKTAIGAWLSKDLVANDKEIANLIKIAKAGQADLLIVGSETLYRHDLTETQLVQYINKVKNEVPKIQVATSDTANMFILYPSIINSIDSVLANIYPYWDGQDINNAMTSLNSQYVQLKKIAKDKKVIISETGWPSSGNTINKAVPSVENAAFYFKNFISWAKATKTQYFYFEAFDEPWKGTPQAPQEAHWGIWDNNLKMKSKMIDVFQGKTIKNNWTTPNQKSVSLPDLTLDSIASNRYLGSYGDASISSKTTSNFTLTLGKDVNTWGSVAVDVGTWVGEKALDLSGYKYAIIRAKGAKGGEKFRFGLGVGPTDYLYDKGLTTNWQNIVIDLSVSIRNLKDVKQIGFEIGSQWTGNKVGTKIYIDGITFSTSKTLKPVPTPTPKPTMTPSPTPRPTATPSPTPSPTPVPTPSPTPVTTPSPTPTPKPTMTPSPTPRPTATPSPTPSPTPRPTATPSPTPSPTPVPLPDLPISSITGNSFCSYGDAGLSDYASNSSFAINLLRNTDTWGSVAVNVGTGANVTALDLSGYKYAIIRVKGAVGGEKFRFGLGYGPTDFYYNQGLTTDWQDIKIDISNFSRNLKDVKQIGFEIGSQWTGNAVGTKIYIGGIKFTD